MILTRIRITTRIKWWYTLEKKSWYTNFMIYNIIKYYPMKKWYTALRLHSAHLQRPLKPHPAAAAGGAGAHQLPGLQQGAGRIPEREPPLLPCGGVNQCHVSRVTSEHVPNVTWRRCEIFNRKKWSRHCWFGPLWLQPERETKQFGSFKATEIQYSFWNNISLNLSPCFLRNKTYIDKIIYSAIIL